MSRQTSGTGRHAIASLMHGRSLCPGPPDFSDAWKSARDMKKTILKSAVGEVRGAYLQEFCWRMVSNVASGEYGFGSQAREPSLESPPKVTPSEDLTNATHYLQGARLINLQRPGKDPDAIWLSYIPVLDLVRKMCSDIRHSEGFVVKPAVKVREVRRTTRGRVQTICEYDHPSTGTFWQNAQAEVRVRNEPYTFA